MGGAQAMIAAGLGFRRNTPAADLIAILRDAEALAGQRATALAAPAFKAAEPGLVEAAAQLGLVLHLIDDAGLAEAQPACVTRSETVRAHTGHAAIAEAAAIAAAGPGARLILPRIAHATATCALAESQTP
jgi:cobalt-precorrin 5A hydrolase